MQEQVLKIASHVTHPGMVAAFAVVVAAVACALALRTGKRRTAWISAVAFIALGLVPFLASAFAQSRGLYRIRLVVVAPDQSLADYAQVKSSYDGELKMIPGGWELEIPPQTRPADGTVTFFAFVKGEFQKGSSTLVLAKDYYPTVTVQLVADTSAVVRGVVVDEDLRAVAGASVSIVGYQNVAVTDAKGNFVLPAHAAQGQMVEIRAQKGQMSGRLSAPAGKVVEVILSHE
jgi:hypothetical protein